MESEVDRQTCFTMDTKGSCFLCLKHHSAADVNLTKENFQRTTFSIKFLCRYLNISLQKVFNITSVSLHSIPSAMENAEVVVYLCQKCSTLMTEFRTHYAEFESIQMHLNGCVWRIQQVAVQADKDQVTVHQFRQRMMKTINPMDLIGVGIFDNLKKEIVEKSSTCLKRAYPKVKLERIQDNGKMPSVGVAKRESFSLGSLVDIIVDEYFPPATEEDCNLPLEVLLKEETPDVTFPDECSATPLPPPPPAKPLGFPSGTEISYKRVGNEKYECQDCGRVVTGFQGRSIHTAVHLGTKPYCCPHCTETFRGPGNLRAHKLAKHKSSFLLSYKDGRISDAKFEEIVNELFEKQNTEKVNGKFMCDQCGKQLVIRSDLFGHLIAVHEEKLVSQLVSVQDSYLNVDAGGPSSSRRVVYQVATTKPKTTQQVVSTKGSDKSQRRNHLAIATTTSSGGNHDGAVAVLPPGRDVPYRILKFGKHGTFECKLCGKMVKGYVGKARHTAIHLGTRPYKCPYCPSSFRCSGNLRSHTYGKHRGVFFIKYKDPRLPETDWDRLVNGFFDHTYTYKRLPNTKMACRYCEGREYSVKSDLLAHMFTTHFELLATQVNNVQIAHLRSNGGLVETASTWRSNQALQITQHSPHFPAAPRRVVKKRLQTSLPTPYKPDSRPAAPTVSRAADVSYRTIVGGKNGKFQCQQCGKLVLGWHGKTQHTRFHLNAPSQFLCNLCPAAFGCPANVRRHKLSKHLGTILLKYKDPLLSPGEYNKLVNDVFEHYEYTKLPDDSKFACDYCEGKMYAKRLDLLNHMITIHIDKILPILKSMQEAHLPNAEAEEIVIGIPNNSNPGTSSRIMILPQQPIQNPLPQSLLRPPPPPPATSTVAKKRTTSRNDGGRRKRIACDYCPLTFGDTSNRRNHTFKHHRDKVFLQFKDPSWDVVEFVKRINDLLKKNSCYMPQGDNHGRPHGCLFCSRGYCQVIDLNSHIIQCHFAEIGEQLLMEGGTLQMQGMMERNLESGESAVNYCETAMDFESHVKVEQLDCSEVDTLILGV